MGVRDEGFACPVLDHAAVLYDHYVVSTLDGGQTVCYDDACPVVQEPLDRMFDHPIGRGVQPGRSLIQD